MADNQKKKLSPEQEIQAEKVTRLLKGGGESKISACKKLKISRPTLDARLVEIPLDLHFVRDVKEILQVDLSDIVESKGLTDTKEEESWRIKYEIVRDENLVLLRENKGLLDRVTEQKKLIDFYESKIKELTISIEKNKSA
jgi:hypothetical protein